MFSDSTESTSQNFGDVSTSRNSQIDHPYKQERQQRQSRGRDSYCYTNERERYPLQKAHTIQSAERRGEIIPCLRVPDNGKETLCHY